MTDLKALREKAMAATPGPWTTARPSKDGDGFSLGVVVAVTAPGAHNRVYTTPRGGSFPAADQKFIAAANPQVILAMIEKLEKQEIALKRIAESPTWTEKNQFGSLITFTYATTTVHWAKEALGVEKVASDV